MKAILKFQLPEEDDEFKWAVEAADFRAEVNEFAERLRALDKHGNSYQDADEAVRLIREIFMGLVGRFL